MTTGCHHHSGGVPAARAAAAIKRVLDGIAARLVVSAGHSFGRLRFDDLELSPGGAFPKP